MANLNSVLAKLATIFNTAPNGDVTQLKAPNIATGTPATGNVPIYQADGTVAWGAQSGGGGGVITGASLWTTANSASKNAYTAPATINNDGITINLTASTGSGSLTNCTVNLNGVAVTGTFNSTGTFPNYVITIPVATITGIAAQTAASVTVAITGTFGGSGFSANCGTLTNLQPIPFTTVLSASYTVTSVPYYTTTASVSYAYTNSAQITSFAGTLTPGGNATSASGSFSNVAITGITISGSATGFGTRGAGTITVPLSGSVPALPTFTPAYYQQTATSALPTWTTSTTQTAGSQIGATITFPAATATTQYDWIATTQPVGKVLIVSSFGNYPITADVTGTALIGGVSFNVFGITSLVVGQQLQLIVSA